MTNANLHDLDGRSQPGLFGVDYVGHRSTHKTNVKAGFR